jgi:hypothetical protein
MTKQQAHDFLNRVAEGFYATSKEITIALFITGDITAHAAVRSTGMDIEASPKSCRGWNERSQRLVEACDSGHRAAAWTPGC